MRHREEQELPPEPARGLVQRWAGHLAAGLAPNLCFQQCLIRPHTHRVSSVYTSLSGPVARARLTAAPVRLRPLSPSGPLPAISCS